MAERIGNMGASDQARLFNESKKRSCDFELILTRFVLERLLAGWRDRGTATAAC